MRKRIGVDVGGTFTDFVLVDEERDLIFTGKQLTSASDPSIAICEGVERIAREAGRVKRFAHGSGIPLKVPVIDLIEIGAGGGSIARIDAMGLMKVGPQSAGSEPGPVCYGRGGRQPTVTDADLWLGYLSPDFFLGGEMRLDAAAVREALEEALSGPAGLGTTEAAAGVHAIVNKQHGCGHAPLHRGQGTRPAPLRTGCHRGRRTRARLWAGRAARHPADHLCPLGAGVSSARRFPDCGPRDGPRAQSR